jgi:hypothetical protein
MVSLSPLESVSPVTLKPAETTVFVVIAILLVLSGGVDRRQRGVGPAKNLQVLVSNGQISQAQGNLRQIAFHCLFF